MVFWKSIAIALAVVLGLSYVGFAYIYSQGGGIMIAGMITGRMQPKVVTLLRNSNITNLQSWNTSVDVNGYKTGFLYFQVIDVLPGGGLIPQYLFEADEILGRNVGFWGPQSGLEALTLGNLTSKDLKCGFSSSLMITGLTRS